MNNEKGTARTKPNVRIVRDFGRAVPDKVSRRLKRYYSIIEPSRRLSAISLLIASACSSDKTSSSLTSSDFSWDASEAVCSTDSSTSCSEKSSETVSVAFSGSTSTGTSRPSATAAFCERVSGRAQRSDCPCKRRFRER